MKIRYAALILSAAILMGGCAYRPAAEPVQAVAESPTPEALIADSASASPEPTPSPTAEPTPSPTSEPTASPTSEPVESQSSSLSASGDAASVVQTDWAGNLAAAADNIQLLTVEAVGTSATVTLHEKGDDGIWYQCLTTTAQIGSGGLGKTMEGDYKTPVGTYHFLFAFGRCADPGTSFFYRQIDDTWYWVDDPASVWYNQVVTTREVTKDWTKTSPLWYGGKAFDYALALDYNRDCVPNVGSAIALHCADGNLTYGCIAVPTEDMITLLKIMDPRVTVLIDTPENLRASY